MSKTTDLYSNMSKLWSEFDENHNRFAEKGNKAAGTRARKAAGEIKKLITPYKKANMEATKS